MSEKETIKNSIVELSNEALDKVCGGFDESSEGNGEQNNESGQIPGAPEVKKAQPAKERRTREVPGFAERQNLHDYIFQ